MSMCRGMPFSACALQKKTYFDVDIVSGKKQIGMWSSVVCTLIDNDMRHHSGQNWLTTVMMCIVVSKSTDHAKPHSIC